MFKLAVFRYFLFCSLFLLITSLCTAQIGLQLSPGIINYGGDLQNNVYTFKEANLSIGADVLYQIKKFSVRGGLHIGKVAGSDANNTRFANRNLSFASDIVDGNLCLQYDVFSLTDKKITPYFFAGIGIFHFNPYTIYNSQKIYLQPLGTEGQGLAVYPDRKMYSLTQPNVPLGIGMKYKVSDHIQIGLEFCSRFLFTDYLDDVSDKYPDENELFKGRGQLAVDVSFRGDEIDPTATFPSNTRRGNPNHSDNFYTTSLTFIYVFSESSFFGGTGKRGKGMKALNCPKNVRE